MLRDTQAITWALDAPFLTHQERRPDLPLAVAITRPSQDRPSLLACGLGGTRGSKWLGRPSQPQVKGAFSRLLMEASLPPVSADVNRSPVLTGRVEMHLHRLTQPPREAAAAPLWTLMWSLCGSGEPCPAHQGIATQLAL